MYYLGQTPAEELLIKVVDERRQPRDLRMYEFTVDVVFAASDGTLTESGSGYISNAYEGHISYEFGPVSPFTMVGDYKVQAKLRRHGSTNYDLTDLAVIEVKRGLI